MLTTLLTSAALAGGFTVAEVQVFEKDFTVSSEGGLLVTGGGPVPAFDTDLGIWNNITFDHEMVINGEVVVTIQNDGAIVGISPNVNFYMTEPFPSSNLIEEDRWHPDNSFEVGPSVAGVPMIYNFVDHYWGVEQHGIIPIGYGEFWTAPWEFACSLNATTAFSCSGCSSAISLSDNWDAAVTVTVGYTFVAFDQDADGCVGFGDVLSVLGNWDQSDPRSIELLIGILARWGECN